MADAGEREEVDKLLFLVRTGELKCSTEKLATVFKDGLCDLVFTLFCGCAFVLLLFYCMPLTTIDARNSHMLVLGKCVPSITLMLTAGPTFGITTVKQ